MKMIENAYTAYLEGEMRTRTHKDAELKTLGDRMEADLAAGALTQDSLDAYEEKAAEAGFYAGFMAALYMFGELGGGAR